jgi:hypothetical protein
VGTETGTGDRVTNGKHTWRAGCGESRTSGSAGGMGKRTEREPGTAPHADPTKWVWLVQAEPVAVGHGQDVEDVLPAGDLTVGVGPVGVSFQDGTEKCS